MLFRSISHPERHPDFPDVPTLWEVGYGETYIPSWYALWAPAGTPQEIIDKLNAKLVEIGNTPAMKQLLLSINVALTPQTAAEMGAFLVKDVERMAGLVKRLNIKLE